MTNAALRDALKQFISATRALRATLRDENIGSQFRFKLQSSGRVQDGELNITVELSNYDYGRDEVCVSGDDIEAVATEYMRRHGWNKAHAPLCLPLIAAVEPSEGDTLQ